MALLEASKAEKEISRKWIWRQSSSFWMPPDHLLKAFFFQARNGQDFNCIMESKEEKEDGITNDEEMKYAKQGQPFKK